MKIMKFDPTKVEAARKTKTVLNLLGLTEAFLKSFKKKYGQTLDYNNTFFSDETFDLCCKNLHGAGERMALCCYSPVSNGPRFEEVEKEYGKIPSGEMWVFEPGDPLYKEPVQ